MVIAVSIPELSQDASFRASEQIIIKAHLFINGIPLKIDATMSMFCSAAPKGLV